MTEQDVGEGTGELQLGLAGQGDLRWAAVDVTRPLEVARGRLDLSPIAAVALGRAMAASALLLRFLTKTPAWLLLEVHGDGPLGKVIAEVNEKGHLRGLVGNPLLPTPEAGGLGIAWAVGSKGQLRVTRESARGRYDSKVELVSGEIGKDVAHYLAQSEQIYSATLLGVLPRPEGIAAAGGLLIEALPGADEDRLAHLERNIAGLRGEFSHYLAEGGIRALEEVVLAGFDREELERYPLVYRCRCSRERLLGSLLHLAANDLEAVAGDTATVEVDCAFCGAHYSFSREELSN